MGQTVVVYGNLNDPRHIVLDEPVSDIRGPVEVAIRSIAESTPVPFFESSTVEEWEREFHAWIDGHDRTTAVPSAESLRREALYEDR
jgi:hypothetical protein